MTRKRMGAWSARVRLRGWGGVTAMAAACAVTASLTLLPLSHGGADAFIGDLAGQGTSQAVQAKADDCTDPEASLPPSSADGPSIEKIKKRGKLIAGSTRTASAGDTAIRRTVRSKASTSIWCGPSPRTS